MPELGRVRRLSRKSHRARLGPDRAPLSAEPLEPALDALFDSWRASVDAGGCSDRLLAAPHGDLPRWRSALARLPEIAPGDPLAVSLGDTVTVGAEHDLGSAQRRRLEEALQALLPWRKGPFRLFGIGVDAEWRSERKWARIAPHLDLSGRRVLDVGCGNGYYGWRMLAAGAASVTGLDPSLLFALQHAAISYYLAKHQRHLAAANLVLPLRIDEFAPAAAFDAVFSMGVVYHRRNPAAHIRELARRADTDALLVVESLVVEGVPLVSPSRYAGMRNVHVVPNVALLLDWLAAAGFARADLVDVCRTTPDEQRSTPWMPYHSLVDALDANDPSRTVEGLPAPQRAVIIARR